MTGIVKWSLNNSTVVYFAVALLAVMGVVSYMELGKLEDPEFTVKRAVVITPYPGAGSMEVEQEITDLIETVVQELDELDQVESISRPGLSIVFVDIKERYWADELPQIWDKLRRKINDAQPRLPPEASASIVRDDFGDVYGVLLAITSDGFSYAELENYAEDLRREILELEDVARAEIWGIQQQRVYVDVSRGKLAERGIIPETVLMTLTAQNMVVDPGFANLPRQRLRMNVTGQFNSIEEISDLLIRGLPDDTLVRIGDIAEVRHGYQDPPDEMMRFNGRPAVGLAVAVTKGGDVIQMGENLNKRLDELTADTPIGIEIGIVSFQPQIVQEAVREFMTNLALAVSIVMVLLLVFIGLRPGILIGANLLLTIAATFIVMRIFGIDFHRVSLGALIIALGMLVDNAVVITEGTLVRLERGEDRMEAPTATVRETAWPLFAATLVAIFAFMPIFLSPNDVGEYAGSLFQVVAISLLASWVLSITFIPLGCVSFLKVEGDPDRQPYQSRVYRYYRALLGKAIHQRMITIGIIAGLLILAVIGFQFVQHEFFPQAIRPQLRLDYWLAEGSQIYAVSEDMQEIEDYALGLDEVESVGSFIGSGPPRFYLPMEPQLPTPVFGQLIINLTGSEHLSAVQGYLESYLAENYPQAEPRVRRFPLGPSTPYQVEARFYGPDVETLRSLAEQAKAIMRQDPKAKDIRHDWRQKVAQIDLDYDQRRGRWTGLAREDLANSLRRSFDGLPIGVYREDDDLMPILLRISEDQRHLPGQIDSIQAWPILMPFSIPIGQAITGMQISWDDPMIRRIDRKRFITAQCDARDIPASALLERLRPEIEAIPLEGGYSLEWAGEHKDSTEARSTVYQALPLTGALILITIIALFNSIRKSLLIIILIPLAIIGITIGLLIVGVPFGFLALLGGFSLAGMMIKNSVVLIEQIDIEIDSGKVPYKAVIKASLSRFRPVLLASMTTVMGMLPLLFDRFWTSMGVTITFGLTFATVLTLVILPVLYSIFFRIRAESENAG